MGEWLPSTTYALLGLLDFFDELSGYELRKAAEGSLRFFFWSPAQSSIYAEMRRASAAGLVTSRVVPGTDAPDKRLYRITDEGRDQLRRWLEDAPIEPMVVKHAVALRVFFGHLARPERLRALLEDHAKATEALLTGLGEVRAGLAGDDRFRYPDLVGEWGERYYRGDLEGTEALLERLTDRGQGQEQEQEGPG